jgi:hypothetical protein
MGYALLIGSIVIQEQLLINVLLTKGHVIAGGVDSFSNRKAIIDVSNFFAGITGYTVVKALYCAISIYVAYTSIHGRVGPM